MMISRRPALAQNRGRTATRGGAATVLLAPPATVSDSILWVDADYLTHSGDGTEVTAATDRSTGANTVVKMAAGGPTYRLTEALDPCFEIGTNKALTVNGTGTTVVSFLNNASSVTKELTVITVWQPRHHLATIPWAWGSTANSTRTLMCRCASNAYKPQIVAGSVGGSVTYDAPTDWAHNVWKVHTVRRSGGGTPVVQHREDGVNQTATAWTNTGNYTCDNFGIGVQDMSADSYSQVSYVKQVIVFNRALTDPEVAAWEVYFGTRYPISLGWKAGLGGTGDTLVILRIGQSNCTGYCLGSPDYSFSASNCLMNRPDGIVRTIAARSGDGVNDASPSGVYPTPVGPSNAAAMAERLRALGETRRIIFVERSVPSTPSASWATNLTAAPPTINDLICNAKHGLRDALKAPNARAVVFIDQGEADANTLVAAQGHQTNWDAIYTELNSYMTAIGGTWDKTHHFFMSRMSVNITGVGGFIADVRTSEDNLAVSRAADMILTQRPDGTCEGTPGLHLTGTEQQSWGVTMADTIWAAS